MFNYSLFSKIDPSSLLIRFAPKHGTLLSQAQSFLAAATVGELYGLGVRYVTQSTAVYPGHYALWFALAYQIQKWLHLSKSLVMQSISKEIPDNPTRYTDRLRLRFRQGINYLDKIDQAISNFFGIKPKKEITPDHIEKARYLEMCRSRAWKVFKSTVVEVLSFSFSYYAVRGLGYALYSNYSFSLYFLVKYTALDSLLVPALHKLVREKPGEERPRVYKWIHYVLPAL